MNGTRRPGAAELVLLGLGRLGAVRVLLGGLLLGGLLLAATGPPLDDPYAARYGLATAAVAALGLLVPAVPVPRRRARVPERARLAVRPAAVEA